MGDDSSVVYVFVGLFFGASELGQISFSVDRVFSLPTGSLSYQ
jgi:hypothetical protein